MALRCSVVVNTFNRAPYLRRLLAALGHLRDTSSFEVIIVNGPSTDRTLDLLQSTYAGLVKVRACPERNLCMSRNIGIEAAAGEIVMFIDDDALPCDERWVERYRQAFEPREGQPVGAVGGPVWDRDSTWAEFDGGATDEYGFQVFTAREGQLDASRWIPRVPGGNCAFSREALRAIGGFDEQYVYYADETDVCIRLARAGYAIRHLPTNGIRHYPAPTSGRSGAPTRNWTVITRSDTYFSLRNARDWLPLRLLRTLAYAPTKHYFREINRSFVARQVGVGGWLSLLGQWGRGLVEGCRAGVLGRRLTRDIRPAPDDFLPFAPPFVSRRLRVALLSQTIPGRPDVGGIGRYTYDLALGLHERGHEVDIICRSDASRVHDTPGFRVHGVGAEDARARTLISDRPITNKNSSYALGVLRKVQQLYLDGARFDVVHASNWDAESAAVIRSRICPVVVTLVSPLAQVIETEGWDVDDDLRLSLALDAWQIQAADTVALPSQGVLTSYRKLMGLDDRALTRVRPLPLGILPDIGPQAPATKTRSRLLFVGRLERRKGAHVLLDVLPRLLARFPDWECVLAGNDRVPAGANGGTLREDFERAHRDASWLSRVSFRGIVPEQELAGLYQSCDLFVAPSLFESFGLVYHEAMQYGKAVVGCATGGVPETVTHGVDGWLVPPGSAPELAEALATLMGDSALRRRLGEAGARRIQEQQNHRTMAAAAEAIYAETLDAPRRSFLSPHRCWPRRLPLPAPDDPRATPAHAWRTVVRDDGRRYLMTDVPDASLVLDVPDGHALELTALRHPWSGVLEVLVNEERVGLVNLFADPLSPAESVRISLPDRGPGPTPVRLRVHPERDPASHGREIWLAAAVARPSPDSVANVAAST